MNRIHEESGQTLIFTALCMMVLLGFMALALDAGLLFRTRRHIQAAADAAALAGALEYYNNHYIASSACGKDNVTCAALTGAANNQVTDGEDRVSIAVHMPPTQGANVGASGFVEVVIRQPNPTFFMGMFTHSLVDVAARAVAGDPLATDGCGWIMNTTNDPKKKDASFYVQGKYDIEAPNCGFYVNSKSDLAFNLTGKAGTLNVAYVNVVGDYDGSPSNAGVPINDHVAPESNPYGDLHTPACGTTDPTTKITANYTPASGVVCFSNAVKISGTVAMNGLAGNGVVYVFTKGLEIDTNANVTFGSAPQGIGKPTNGAVVDLDGGVLKQDSNSLLSMYAPTDGTFNGIAIMQPSNNTNQLQLQFGSNNEVLDGMIYAPKAEVYLQDNGGGVKAAGFVVGSLHIQSSSFTITDYNQVNKETTKLRVITLVE